jgi:1,4-dihydroxy-2-naphthoyl-CoA hydrolase
MSIWFKQPNLEQVNSWSKGTILEQIGVEITVIGDDYVEGTMPADNRTFQPYGLIHGGANVVLAESLGSTGGALTLDLEKYRCVGQEVNANHLRGVTSGIVTGRAIQLYAGRRSQVWETKIYDSRNKLACISRLTLAIIES